MFVMVFVVETIQMFSDGFIVFFFSKLGHKHASVFTVVLWLLCVTREPVRIGPAVRGNNYNQAGQRFSGSQKGG